jgi:hypothetical protein
MKEGGAFTDFACGKQREPTPERKMQRRHKLKPPLDQTAKSSRLIKRRSLQQQNRR